MQRSFRGRREEVVIVAEAVYETATVVSPTTGRGLNCLLELICLGQ